MFKEDNPKREQDEKELDKMLKHMDEKNRV